MIRITNLRRELDEPVEALKAKAAAILRLKPEQIKTWRLVKQSVDARKKADLHFSCGVEVEVAKESEVLNRVHSPKVTVAKPFGYQLPVVKRPPAQPPVVVGSGPAGLFAALTLARAGLQPVLLERGQQVEQRSQDVARFRATGILLAESNVQFGEGGAGTFSDGKLTTGTKDPRVRLVLEDFAAAGAPEDILYLAKPHIGTDYLKKVVAGLRQQIIALGGQVRFGHRLTGLLQEQGRLTGVEVAGSQGLYCQEACGVILAIGHSARDTYQMLYEAGVPMTAKAFSLGARIEHPQAWLNQAQYGKYAGHPALGAADYKLVSHLGNGRSVYTFCMCPGGEVVAAASSPGKLVTNGMSHYARAGENCNAALLVGVGPADFPSDHPLAGIQWQQQLEEMAYQLGGGGFQAPVQLVEDFIAGRASQGLGDVEPTYRPGMTPSDLAALFPQELVESLRQGILDMDRQLPGFARPDAVLTGVESRSSSPVRILRDETGQSALKGLYPVGEGAGYAGGIVSAGVDGIKGAEQLMLALC